MPLKSGSSSATVSENIRELHSGNTYAKTASKFGKAKANKQAIAIALSKARGRSMGGPAPVGLMSSPMDFQGNPATPAMPSPIPAPASPFAEQTDVPVGLAPGGGGMVGQPQNNVPMAPPGAMDPALGVAGRAFGGGMDTPRSPMTKGPLVSSVPGRIDAHKTHVPSGSYVVPADIVSGKGQGNTLAGMNALQKLFRMGPYGSPSPMRGQNRGPKVGNTKHFAAGGSPSDSDDIPVPVNLAGGELVVPPQNIQQVVHPDLKTAHDILDRWVLRERRELRKTLAKLPGPAKGNE